MRRGRASFSSSFGDFGATFLSPAPSRAACRLRKGRVILFVPSDALRGKKVRFARSDEMMARLCEVFRKRFIVLGFVIWGSFGLDC